MQNQNNEFKGFSLFNDIEDAELRTRNRSVVMCNIAEDHVDRKTKRISPKGAALILNYFANIPAEEREIAKNKFAEDMNVRGFALAA
jgi:hypothetical protein